MPDVGHEIERRGLGRRHAQVATIWAATLEIPSCDPTEILRYGESATDMIQRTRQLIEDLEQPR